MALILGAYGGATIIGRSGADVFQRGAFGNVVRSGVIPVNPNSIGQVAVRYAMKVASDTWSGGMSLVQQASWRDYAATTPLPSKLGGSHIVSGRTMFIRSTILQLMAGEAVLLTAPPTPGIGTLKLPVITADASSGITLDDFSPVLAAGDLVQVSLSPPLGQANNYWKGPFNTGIVVKEDDALPLTLKAAGPSLVVGQYYFVRTRTYNLDGKVSNEQMYRIGPVVS